MEVGVPVLVLISFLCGVAISVLNLAKLVVNVEVRNLHVTNALVLMTQIVILLNFLYQLYKL